MEKTNGGHIPGVKGLAGLRGKSRRTGRLRRGLSAAVKGLFSALAMARALVANILMLVVVGAVGAVLWAGYQEIQRPQVTLALIKVPEDLVEKGQSPAVVVQEIAYRIEDIAVAANTSRHRRPVSLAWSQSDALIGGNDTSVKSALRVARRMLGRDELRIGGEITREGELLRLRLRARGAASVAMDDLAPSAELNALLDAAARNIVRIVDPYLLAIYYYEQDNIELTRSTLEYCLKDANKDCRAWAYNLSGFLSYESGDPTKAEESYRNALKEKNISLAHYNLGNILFDKENYLAAEKEFNAALALDSEFAEFHRGLGNVHHKLGNLGKAIEKYRQALKIDPNQAATYNDWGDALEATGAHRQAIDKYRRTIEIDPEFAAAYSGRGNALAASGAYREAIESYRKAMEIDPESPPPYSGWGNALRALGKHREAIEMYRKAVAIDPASATDYNLWGNVLLDLGQHRKAIGKYKSAVEADPDFAFAYNGWGNALRALRKHREAIEKYRKAVDIDPGYAFAYNGWGNALLELGEHPQAIEKYQLAIEIDPKLGGAYYNRGLIYLRLGERDKAVLDFRRAKELLPGVPGPVAKLRELDENK